MNQLLVVRLDQQRFALHLPEVERVVRMVAITALPQAPESVLGLINLQGRLLQVVSLRGCLGLPERQIESEHVLVIVRTAQCMAALTADGIEGVHEAREQEMAGVAEVPGQAYLQGVVKLADGLVPVCDLDRIMARLLQPQSDAFAAPPRRAAPGEAGTGKILAERADLLAREPAAPGGGESIELVEFLLGGERYAIALRFVGEVQHLRELTSLPGTPPFLLGLMNMRGRILSVIDLRRFFELPEPEGGELRKVIILRDAYMEFGIVADAMVGVRTIPLRALQPALPTLTGIRGDFLKGVTGERLALLDAGKLLTDRRLVVHDEI